LDHVSALRVEVVARTFRSVEMRDEQAFHVDADRSRLGRRFDRRGCLSSGPTALLEEFAVSFFTAPAPAAQRETDLLHQRGHDANDIFGGMSQDRLDASLDID